MDAFAGSSGVSDSDGMGTPVLSVCTPKIEGIDNYYYAHVLRIMGKMVLSFLCIEEYVNVHLIFGLIHLLSNGFLFHQ